MPSAMIASLVKTIQLRVLASTTDPTVDTVVLVRWLYIETYLVITTASIPSIKPLIMGSNTMKSSKGYTTYRMYGGRKGRGSWFSNSHNRATDARDIDPARSDGGSEQNILYEEQPMGRITKKTDVFISIEPSTGTHGSWMQAFNIAFNYSWAQLAFPPITPEPDANERHR